MPKLMGIVGAMVAWGAAGPFLLLQDGASHFDVTFSDIVALAGLITGPPTVLVFGMWRHLSNQHKETLAEVDSVRDSVDEAINKRMEVVGHRVDKHVEMLTNHTAAISLDMEIKVQSAIDSLTAVEGGPEGES